jgi:hypothetical protein
MLPEKSALKMRTRGPIWNAVIGIRNERKEFRKVRVS